MRSRNGLGEQQWVDEASLSQFLSKVFLVMFGGLMLTGLTGYIVAQTPALAMLFLGNTFVFIMLAVTTLGLVAATTYAVERLSPLASKVLFIVYSFVNGLTFSIYFIAYDLGDMAIAFLLTGGLFALMSCIGFKTKKDVTKLGSLSIIALVGLLFATIINIFLGNTLLDIMLSAAIILVFMGLIVYDTKMLKDLYITAKGDEDRLGTLAIRGALSLYLDFINIFIRVLRVVARARSRR